MFSQSYLTAPVVQLVLIIKYLRPITLTYLNILLCTLSFPLLRTISMIYRVGDVGLRKKGNTTKAEQ